VERIHSTSHFGSSNLGSKVGSKEKNELETTRPALAFRTEGHILDLDLDMDMDLDILCPGQYLHPKK